MATLQKVRILPQQRIDLTDFNNLSEFVCADFKAIHRTVWAKENYIFNGFEATGNGTNELNVSIAGASCILGENDGTLYVGADSLENLSTDSLTPSSTNFIEISLSQDTGGADSRAFWDQTAAAGQGGEFSQIVDTYIFLKADLNINTSNFSGDADKIPVCEVDVNSSGTITAIRDRRNLFYRLGKGSDVDFRHSWSSRTEPPETQFTGADKDLDRLKTFFDAVMSRIAEISGGTYWYEDIGVSLSAGFRNSALSTTTALSPSAKWSWDGSSLLLTDDSGTPSNTDALAGVRLFDSISNLSLTRQDGTGSSSSLSLADGDVLWVEIPDPLADVTYDGVGLTSSNFRISARGSVPNDDTTFWIAYREGNNLYLRGHGELQPGETAEISDNINENILNVIGITSETADPVYPSDVVVTQNTNLVAAIGELDSALDSLFKFAGAIGAGDETPPYTSDIRGVTEESLVARASALTDAVGDEQEDRSAFVKSDEVVTWTGTQLEFTADLILEILNTKNGTLTEHTIALAESPITLANGESLWVNVDRAQVSETLTINKSGTTPIPAQTQANKDVFVLFKRIDTAGGEALLYLPFSKQVMEEGQSSRLGASGSGSAAVKSTFYDPISTALPTGSSVTIDGVAGADGDTVLFSNLSSGNNQVYELSGVGSSITWDPVRAFGGDFTPTDGDSIRIEKGDAFREQLVVFNGTDFEVNDVVRFFDGKSANFWELSSIKNLTLSDNTSGNVFSVNAVGSENFIVHYSLLRGSAKETGMLMITSDGTDAAIARSNAYLGNLGIDFTVQVNSGDLELNYVSDASGSNATLKYFVKRWSNAVTGGPTGIPNYSSSGSSTVAAAGVPGDIQFHGSDGNLDADPKLKWDGTLDAIDLNGLKYSALSGSITLNDAQSTPSPIISWSENDFNFAIIEYSVVRDGGYRTGRMLVSNDLSGNTGFSDDFIESSATGITFSANVVTGNVRIEYTSTSTGNTGEFKYSIRRWK